MKRAQTYQVPKGKTKNGTAKKESQPLASAPHPLPEGELVISFYDSAKELLSTETFALTKENQWETLSFSTKAEEKGFVSASIRGTSSEPVKFDDFSIQLKSLYSAKLYQENHYYPFGMNMKGLESSDKQTQQNKKEHEFQFNAKTEREEEFGLFWDETPFRAMDMQLGRFWGVDLLSEKYQAATPFHYSLNNPISLNDPTGLEAVPDWLSQIVSQSAEGKNTTWTPDANHGGMFSKSNSTSTARGQNRMGGAFASMLESLTGGDKKKRRRKRSIFSDEDTVLEEASSSLADATHSMNSSSPLKEVCEYFSNTMFGVQVSGSAIFHKLGANLAYGVVANPAGEEISHFMTANTDVNGWDFDIEIQIFFVKPISSAPLSIDDDFMGYGEGWSVGVDKFSYSKGWNNTYDKRTYDSHALGFGIRSLLPWYPVPVTFSETKGTTTRPVMPKEPNGKSIMHGPKF